MYISVNVDRSAQLWPHRLNVTAFVKCWCNYWNSLLWMHRRIKHYKNQLESVFSYVQNVPNFLVWKANPAGTGPIFDIIYWSFFSWHQIYVILTWFSEVTSYDQYVISILCHMTWLSAKICLWCQNDIKMIITQDQFLLKKSNLSLTAI